MFVSVSNLQLPSFFGLGHNLKNVKFKIFSDEYFKLKKTEDSGNAFITG